MNKLTSKITKTFDPYRGLPKEVYIIVFARFINALGLFVFPLLVFILTQKVGLTEAEAGFWITLTGFIWIPTSLIGGKLTDIIGRKKIIVFFDTLAALTFIACAFTEPSMNMVYLIMLSTFFLGFTEPAHGALIADITTPENRTGAYSLSYLGFNLGYAVGPVLGGILLKFNLLRILFIIDATTALIAVSLVFFFIKETFKNTKEELSENRHLEKSESGSILNVLFKRPILIYFSLIMFGYNFTYAQWGFLMPLHLAEKFNDQGSVIYGTLSAFNGCIVVGFTTFLTTLLHKKPNLRKIVYGGILYAVGLGLLGYINMLPAFYLSIFIFTIGEIVVTISFMPFIANHTPASHRGRMNSVLPLIMGIGYTIAPLSTGKTLEFISIETAWKIISIVSLISALFMYLLEKMDKKHDYKESEVVL